jgi:hypothetical protein
MTINAIINESQPIHIWQGLNGRLMVSFENTKRLYDFDDFDDAINYFFLSNKKEIARTLNRLKQRN